MFLYKLSHQLQKDASSLAKVSQSFLLAQAGFHTGFSVWGGGGCCVWNRLSDENLTHLMRIAMEGPDLNEVNIKEILDILKVKK